MRIRPWIMAAAAVGGVFAIGCAERDEDGDAQEGALVNEVEAATCAPMTLSGYECQPWKAIEVDARSLVTVTPSPRGGGGNVRGILRSECSGPSLLEGDFTFEAAAIFVEAGRYQFTQCASAAAPTLSVATRPGVVPVEHTTREKAKALVDGSRSPEPEVVPGDEVRYFTFTMSTRFGGLNIYWESADALGHVRIEMVEGQAPAPGLASRVQKWDEVFLERPGTYVAKVTATLGVKYSLEFDQRR